MILSIIAAMGKNREIGFNNSLPWHLPADLKYFKKNTFGKTIVMGQRTFESVGGKPLPGRKTIILSDDYQYKTPQNCLVAHSLNEVLNISQKEKEVMICGGASIYKQFLPLADRLYITFIHHNFKADTYFPEINWEDWQEIKRIDNLPDNENPYSYSFLIFERKKEPKNSKKNI